jgi:hypothetical protein
VLTHNQRSSGLNHNNLTNGSSTPNGTTPHNSATLTNNAARPNIHRDDAPLPDYITHPNRPNVSVPPPAYSSPPNGFTPLRAHTIHRDDAPLPDYITRPNRPNGSVPPPAYSARQPPPSYSRLSISSISQRQLVGTPNNSPQPRPAAIAENQTQAQLNPPVLKPMRPAPPLPQPGRSAPGIPGPGISPYAGLPRAFDPPRAPRPAFASPVARPLIVRTPTARQPIQQPNADGDGDDMEEDMASGTRRRGGGKPVKRQSSSKKKGDGKRVKTEKKEEAWNDPEKVLGDGNCETYQDRTNISVCSSSTFMTCG